MIMYVSTWEASFDDPDDQYLNVEKNTVCGIFRTYQEAMQRIVEYATSNLFYGVQDKIKETIDGLVIDDPGYVHAEFHIHEHVIKGEKENEQIH